MPLLKPTGDILTGTTRAKIIYNNSTRSWPDQEIWSSWYEVGTTASGSVTCAWFSGGNVDHYDTGGHERVRFRYSSKGRVHWRGIMKNISGTTLAAGFGVVGCNIVDTTSVPKPVDDNRMIYGVSSAKADMGGYSGTVVRYNLAPYTYHHLLQMAVHDNTAMPAGAWFAIDGIASFSADT